MKSNVINFKVGQDKIREILNETEKVAKYNGLNEKETLRLRLLAEEVSGIIKELLNEFDGEFYIENDGKNYSINLSILSDTIDDATKQKLISVASSGKNELAKGFMGKVRSIVEFFAVAPYAPITDMYGYYVNPLDIYNVNDLTEQSLWSLDKYKSDVKNHSDWDELEKSIVANLADDVTVGVMGKKIKVSVKKSF